MLGPKVNFKHSKLPSKRNLKGKYVLLEPFKISKHSRDLFNNFLKDKKNLIWKYLPYGPFKTYKNFKKWTKSFCLNSDPFFLRYIFKKIKSILWNG